MLHPRPAVQPILIDKRSAPVDEHPEHRAFYPHITLARWKRDGAAATQVFLDRNRALASPAFAVTSFILCESHLTRHGPHYEAVAEYRLG